MGLVVHLNSVVILVFRPVPVTRSWNGSPSKTYLTCSLLSICSWSRRGLTLLGTTYVVGLEGAVGVDVAPSVEHD